MGREITMRPKTIENNSHAVRIKTWPTNDFELTVQDLYHQKTDVYFIIYV